MPAFRIPTSLCTLTVLCLICLQMVMERCHVKYLESIFYLDTFTILFVYRYILRRVFSICIRGVATGGGYIGIYTPKSVSLKFFMWLFCLLDPGQIRCRAIYTHPNLIPGYASDLYLRYICGHVSVGLSVPGIHFDAPYPALLTLLMPCQDDVQAHTRARRRRLTID